MFQKLEKLIFYTLIFSIPFQTRIILRSWGIGFNEWNAAFLYWTDLLILALFTLWFLRHSHFYDISRKSDSQKNNFFSNYDWFLVGFIVISAISVKNASNQVLGLYQLLKLTEFSLLYFYIKSAGFGFKNLKTALGILLASGFFQAVLAILQYFRQADVGLRFLGETVLNPDLFNVAVFIANGEKVLRPYGTTPHPNVLALFLFIAIFIYYFSYVEGNKFLRSKSGLVIYSALLFSFLLTFSRIIIFVWLVGLGLRWLILNKVLGKVAGSINLRSLTVATAAVLIIFSIFFWPEVLARLEISPQKEVVSLRAFYNKVSLFEKPFFGVGLGNFVNWFKEINPGLAPNLYQPVHNIYLLIFSETGVLGLAAFLLFLFFLAKNYLSLKFNRPLHFSFFIIFLSLLFFGLFDHFLLTIQQGRIVFWLVLGLLAGVSKSPYSSIG